MQPLGVACCTLHRSWPRTRAKCRFSSLSQNAAAGIRKPKQDERLSVTPKDPLQACFCVLNDDSSIHFAAHRRTLYRKGPADKATIRKLDDRNQYVAQVTHFAVLIMPTAFSGIPGSGEDPGSPRAIAHVTNARPRSLDLSGACRTVPTAPTRTCGLAAS
jgi:hypothetical protein